MSSPDRSRDWVVVVPVRGGGSGKTRLTAIEGHALSAQDRVLLTTAMAQDTVDAALAAQVGPVLVLTGDDAVRELAHECGADVLPDRGRGLNAELTDAARSARDGVCVLLGDLPALTPQAVTAAVTAAEGDGRGAVFVPDQEGLGTTTVALRRGATVHDLFRFGPDSARRHRTAGLRPVGLDQPTLRCDVDTAEAWDRARAIGLGPATTAARRRIVDRARLRAPARPDGHRYAATMSQATVHVFEPSTGGGSVLLDDGEEVRFTPEAFTAGGLRLLRPGQRVSLEHAADGRIVRVYIRGIGDDQRID